VKFIVAPNALKGSLSAKEAALAISKGLTKKYPEAEIFPLLIADGGDGFVDALQHGLSAQVHRASVTGPTGSRVDATFLYAPTNKVAVIEMATAAGLALLKKHELDPMGASTVGVGELLKCALDLGAKHIVLGIGGSATNDGGTGMATALGIRFLDASGQALVGNGENLSKICQIDCTGMDRRLTDITLEVACDVNNPLLGEEGAAHIYGPQKGATNVQVAMIENGLSHLADVIKKDLQVEVRDLSGGGAAGGLGAGLFAFYQATLKPGAELLLDILAFDKHIKGACVVITTEGKLDVQTGFGKAPAIVAKRAAKQGVPTIAIAGQIEGQGIDWQALGFAQVYSLCDDDIDADYAMSHAACLLEEKTQQVIDGFFAE